MTGLCSKINIKRYKMRKAINHIYPSFGGVGIALVFVTKTVKFVTLCKAIIESVTRQCSSAGGQTMSRYSIFLRSKRTWSSTCRSLKETSISIQKKKKRREGKLH
jgi:hypothetical protein